MPSRDPNKQFVARVRSAAKRLAKAATEVTDGRSFVRFTQRLVRWNTSHARMAGELMGEPGWSDAVESSLRKVANAALEGAEHQRNLDRQWEIERLEARERAARNVKIDDATRQYQAEVRAMVER